MIVDIRHLYMKRRSVLFALGGAGILGVSGYQMSGMGATHGPKRTVSVSSQDDIPDRYEMSITVDVLQDEITSSQTARLRVTTTNTGEKRGFSIGKHSCSLFNRSRGGSDDPAGLWLYRPQKAENLERRGTKWMPNEFQWESRGFSTKGCGSTVYEPRQRRSTVYEVWDDYKVDGYLESGTYRWEQEVEIYTDPDEAAGLADDSFTWGFELNLEEKSDQ